jgi:2-oxoglutarate dehydrogenase E1 component
MFSPQGQVYYSLLQEREAKGIKDVAISRVEQFSPFPYDLVSCILSNLGDLLIVSQITPHLDAYPNADILWCQVRSCAIFPHPHD